VFSNSLDKADWSNTRVVKGDIAAEVRRLKLQGKNMTVLGSGSIVAQLTDARLIDTFMIMVDPIALSGGTPVFNGIKKNLALELADHRIFKSGRVLLTYKPRYT
jgi:dihydrofolate reductase